MLNLINVNSLILRSFSAVIKNQIRIMSSSRSSRLFLFDVDGTLTLFRKKITPEMFDFLRNVVKPKVSIGLVGGSDYAKIAEQMGGEEGLQEFDYIFSENGLIVHQNGKAVFKQSIQDFVGEEKLQDFINFALRYMSNMKLPVKRGNFIEFRTGLINVCPVGRSCTQEERDNFEKYDKEHGIRKNFVAALQKEFPDSGLQFSIGGQISIDVFPVGWDKTFCLQHVAEKNYEMIHFFGDKTSPGGNDYEIFADSRTIGHTVLNPEDTKKQVLEILGTFS